MSVLFLLNLNKRENQKQNEKELALVYKFCWGTLASCSQHISKTLF